VPSCDPNGMSRCRSRGVAAAIRIAASTFPAPVDCARGSCDSKQLWRGTSTVVCKLRDQDPIGPIRILDEFITPISASALLPSSRLRGPVSKSPDLFKFGVLRSVLAKLEGTVSIMPVGRAFLYYCMVLTEDTSIPITSACLDFAAVMTRRH
jgi:hypothetical protein